MENNIKYHKWKDGRPFHQYQQKEQVPLMQLYDNNSNITNHKIIIEKRGDLK